MKKNKNYLWAVVTLVIALISIWAVSSQINHLSFTDFIDHIKAANPVWLGVAALCMFGFIFFEGHALSTILKGFGHKRSLKKGLLYSAADIYFSAITPSATGGQPASALFMMRDGIPAGIATVALLLNLVMYTLSIMVLGIVALIARPFLFVNFNSFSKFLIILGYIVLGALCVFIFVLIKNGSILHRFCNWIIKILGKLRIIKDVTKISDKITKTMTDYEQCARMIDGQRGMLVKSFCLNFLQRFFLICVPACIYLGTGGSGIGAINVWAIQVFVTMGSNYIPIPGAMGIIDYLMLDGYRDMMTPDIAANMDLLSRGISFYICTLLCGLAVLIGHIIYRKREEERDNR